MKNNEKEKIWNEELRKKIISLILVFLFKIIFVICSFVNSNLKILEKVFDSTSSAKAVDDTIKKFTGYNVYSNIARQIFDTKDMFVSYDKSIIDSLGDYSFNFNFVKIFQVMFNLTCHLLCSSNSTLFFIAKVLILSVDFSHTQQSTSSRLAKLKIAD